MTSSPFYAHASHNITAANKPSSPPLRSLPRSGALVETESELIDDKGNVYYKFITADFMIGAYGFTETGITKAEKVNVPKRAPDAEVELETTPEQAPHRPDSFLILAIFIHIFAFLPTPSSTW